MMENMISVIVCTYNQEGTIGRTLDSILMQQCHIPFEIIIGEDCSTDRTREVCRQYAGQHPDTIRLLCNEQNKGLIDNYFDCILAARGQYIADCAGDDFWVDPLKLEKEVSILEAHDNVTLVHSDWAYYDEATGLVRRSPDKPFTDPFTQGNTMLETIITQTRTPVVHLCTAVYRTAIVRQALKENPSLLRNTEFGCEDVPITFLMAQQGDIAYLPDVTLHYSQGHDSLSFSADEAKQFRFAKRVTYLSHCLAEKYQIRSSKTEHYFQLRLFELGMHAFRAYDKSLYQETLQCQEAWHIPDNTKTSILFAVMRHEWLWQLGLLSRKIFVSAKQLLR